MKKRYAWHNILGVVDYDDARYTEHSIPLHCYVNPIIDDLLSFKTEFNERRNNIISSTLEFICALDLRDGLKAKPKIEMIHKHIMKKEI